MTIELSIIIPLYGFQPQREEALANTLKAIDAQDFLRKGTNERRYEVVVVEQASPKSHIFPQRQHFRHITLPAQEAGFNKSWAMNVGARNSTTSSLVFLDVDMVFDKTYFNKINQFKRLHRDYFTCWQYIVTMPGKDNPVARIITQDILTSGGAFYVDRDFFWRAGGMNENYFGYGGEDNDLWVRVNRLLGSKEGHNVPSMPYALAHWYHDWAAPSPDRFYPLNRTNQFTNEIMARLQKAKLGNVSHPTPIDISDLQLTEAGLEEKDGKGLNSE
jgi:predicted glycosyltransferase involved in capsule biosynthesis